MIQYGDECICTQLAEHGIPNPDCRFHGSLHHFCRKELATLTALLREAGEVLEEVEMNIPESEIDLAREAWGNTNSRIVKDVVRRAADIQKRIQEVVNV